MNKLINKCPVCREQLKIASLKCDKCGLELNGSFEISPFDRLDEDQYSFLISFLKNKGNLKNVQIEKDMSYPTAKKALDDMLVSLGLIEEEEEKMMEVPDMGIWEIDDNSNKASEIIKKKLKENGGRATIYTARGLPCEISASPDGKKLISNKLGNNNYGFEVFDLIVDFLIENGGRAVKGDGRHYRLGHPKCDESTVVGYVAKHYSGKKDGQSVFDPAFVFAAVLDWAGIAENGRGELILRSSYKAMLK